MKKPKKAANLARAIWRTSGYCANCGKKEGKMDGAHIYGVGAYPRIQADLRNGMALCFSCHRKSHDDHEFMEAIMLKQKWFAKYKDALIEARSSSASKPKIDWDERIIFLKDVLKQIEAGELTLEQARDYEM